MNKFDWLKKYSSSKHFCDSQEAVRTQQIDMQAHKDYTHVKEFLVLGIDHTLQSVN